VLIFLYGAQRGILVFFLSAILKNSQHQQRHRQLGIVDTSHTHTHTWAAIGTHAHTLCHSDQNKWLDRIVQ